MPRFTWNGRDQDQKGFGLAAPTDETAITKDVGK